MVEGSGTLPDSLQTPCIGLIAHDMKKDVLIEVLREFVPSLQSCHIVPTRGTVQLCAGRLGLGVTLVNGASEGGDLEIGALVAEGQIDALLYLRDPSMPQSDPHQLLALARAYDVHGVPLATNAATARAVLMVLDRLKPGLGIRPSQGSRCETFASFPDVLAFPCTSKTCRKWQSVAASSLRTVNTPLMFA